MMRAFPAGAAPFSVVVVPTALIVGLTATALLESWKSTSVVALPVMLIVRRSIVMSSDGAPGKALPTVSLVPWALTFTTAATVAAVCNRRMLLVPAPVLIVVDVWGRPKGLPGNRKGPL